MDSNKLFRIGNTVISSILGATVTLTFFQVYQISNLSKRANLIEEKQTLIEDRVEDLGVSLFYIDNVIQRVTEKSSDDTDTEEEISAVSEKEQPDEPEVQKNTEVQIVDKAVGQNVELPNLPTDRKVCTDYRVYNIAGTPHNRMQKLAWTDELGCRRYGDYYIVGLGSAYADRVGETFEVELSTGATFKIITGDMKADIHTDSTNRYAPMINYSGEQCANILEFIIDKDALAKAAYQWGGVDYYQIFKGDIVRMTYLGRDTSADWDTYL